MISILGYVLRALAENKPSPWRRVFVRLLMAVIAGVVILAALPNDLAPHWRVAVMLLGGAATPELVRILTAAALKRVQKETGDDKSA